MNYILWVFCDGCVSFFFFFFSVAATGDGFCIGAGAARQGVR